MRYSESITATLCELFRIAATTPREVADVQFSLNAHCDGVYVSVHPGGYAIDRNPGLSLVAYPAWTFAPGETDHEPTAILAQLRAYLATLSDAALPLAPVGTCVPCDSQMATDADGRWVAKDQAV